MPSPPLIHTIDITLDRSDKSVFAGSIKALLHSILFHRSFDTVKPVTREVLDVTFSAANDAGLDMLIDTRTQSFIRYLDALSSSHLSTTTSNQQFLPEMVADPSTTEGIVKGQIIIQFNEKVMRRSNWWGNRAQETEECWEKWILSIGVLNPRTEKDQQKARKAMEKSLRAGLLNLIVATQKTDHIPPITSNETTPFPYQIIIPSMPYQAGSGVAMEGEGWGAVLKKTLFDATTGGPG